MFDIFKWVWPKSLLPLMWITTSSFRKGQSHRRYQYLFVNFLRFSRNTLTFDLLLNWWATNVQYALASVWFLLIKLYLFQQYLKIQILFDLNFSLCQKCYESHPDSRLCPFFYQRKGIFYQQFLLKVLMWLFFWTFYRSS